MSGVLQVVATPIGNLSDLSPRAAAALREAALVLAEDTRRARILTDHVGSTAKVVSCHQHNEVERAAVAIERIQGGDRVAFVSDAGAPSVSDPGGRLVDAVARAGLPVEVIPGPSALVAALMGAGLAAPRFAFLGFLPRKAGPRRALLARVDASFGLVLFEASNRVEETLRALAEALGPKRVVVARELTKRFETFHRGTLGGPLEPPFVDKGEVVIVVEAGAEGEGAPERSPEAEASELEAVRNDASLRPREKAKALAKALGVSTKEAYDIVRGEAPLPSSSGPPSDAERGPPSDAEGDPPSSADDGRAPPPGADEEGVTGGGPPRHLAPAAERIHAAVERSRAARARLLAALAEAARALVEADAAAREGAPRLGPAPPVGSDIEGVDALLALLDADPALPAPVETREAARALLAALSAADALDDALGFAAGGG